MPEHSQTAPEPIEYGASDMYVYTGGEGCSDKCQLPRYLGKRVIKIGECFADPSKDWTLTKGFTMAPPDVQPVAVGAKPRQMDEPAEAQHLRRALRQTRAELRNTQSTCRGLAAERNNLAAEVKQLKALLSSYTPTEAGTGEQLLSVAELDAMPFADARTYAKKYGVAARSSGGLLKAWSDYLAGQE